MATLQAAIFPFLKRLWAQNNVQLYWPTHKHFHLKTEECQLFSRGPLVHLLWDHYYSNTQSSSFANSSIRTTCCTITHNGIYLIHTCTEILRATFKNSFNLLQLGFLKFPIPSFLPLILLLWYQSFETLFNNSYQASILVRIIKTTIDLGALMPVDRKSTKKDKEQVEKRLTWEWFFTLKLNQYG